MNLAMLELLDFFKKQNYSFIRWRQNSYGTFAYLVTHGGARKLANKLTQMKNIINLEDVWTPGKYVADYLLYDMCESYICCDVVAIEDARFKSTIETSASLRTGESITPSMQYVMDLWNESLDLLN